MIGYVVSVHFPILTGGKAVKNAMSLECRVVLCRDLRIGSVPNAEILTMLADTNVTAASNLN